MAITEYCICPICERKYRRDKGKPCRNIRCHICGNRMLREGSSNYLLFRKLKKDHVKHQ